MIKYFKLNCETILSLRIFRSMQNLCLENGPNHNLESTTRVKVLAQALKNHI